MIPGDRLLRPGQRWDLMLSMERKTPVGLDMKKLDRRANQPQHHPLMADCMPSTPSVLNNAARWLLFCLLAVWLSGCALLHLRQETATLYNSTIVVGLVGTEKPGNAAPIVVVAQAATGSERTIVHRTVLHEPGPYELMVPQGRWHIVAFADANGDLAWQPGEMIGFHEADPVVVEHPGGVIQDVHIIVGENRPLPFDWPANTPVTPTVPASAHYTSSGVVRPLDDPLFNEENGMQGFWRPVEFFHEHGGTISFLRPFDSNKIPILFVHGAAGTPAGWRYLVDHLDLERYQPWFFFYPSGASIKSMADLLFWKMINLKQRYPVQEMHIVAHSMGGLVVRSFLVDYGHLFPSIRTFVSLSTPWNGDDLVEKGLKYSPGVIPAWKDMDPNGAFVQSIYRKQLPPTVTHYLLFGHRGNRNPLRPNNDGVVTLATQLDPRAQAEARMVVGFEEDHGSILASDRVATVLHTLLGQSKSPEPHQTATNAGFLTIHFVPTKTDNLDIWPEISIVPKNRMQPDGYFLRENLRQSDRPLGPFPAGDYEIRVMVNGFKVDQARHEVTIGADRHPTLQVRLAPTGAVVGMVHRRFYQDADPAGVYMPLDRDAALRAVCLSGLGVERRLVPMQGEEPDLFRYYEEGRDWVYRNGFAFYDVPRGEYTVTVDADGQPPHSARVRVEPGRSSPVLGIVLP